MDTNKKDRKRESQEEIDLTNEEEVERLRKEFVGEPPDTSFDEARKHNEEVMQSILHSFDEKINSRWIGRKDKSHLIWFRYILKEQKRMADVLVSTNESLSQWAYGLKQTLFAFFLEIELTKGLAQKDIGTIKSRLDKILENPALQHLEKILKDNEEAFKKLDKTRQDILRDSVV